MSSLLTARLSESRAWKAVLVVSLLTVVALLGQHGDRRILVLLCGCSGAFVLLAKPVLGLAALVIVALVVPMSFGTGSGVSLNPAALLVPALTLVWLFDMILRKRIGVAQSSANKPLLLFLLSGLLSLMLGNALWDPTIPRPHNMSLVQLGQWGIFLLSALAFWLMGNLVRNELWLRRLTWVFLLLGGAIAIAEIVPGAKGIVNLVTTGAQSRAPFRLLLTSIAAGQLLFNRDLSASQTRYLFITLLAIGYYAFFLQREGLSNWVGVSAVVGTLLWQRFAKFRWLTIVLLLSLTLSGFLFPTVYRFAGGDDEWDVSGGSRLALGGRVIEETMRNPLLGLGPASYRAYAGTRPLKYGAAVWANPRINSHNNYIDLFAQGGIVGLALFLWFMAEVTKLGLHLRGRITDGFEAGFVAGMLAALAATAVVMMLADWFLPFVYNIGFHGFQASVLVWMFLGGLVALKHYRCCG